MLSTTYVKKAIVCVAAVVLLLLCVMPNVHAQSASTHAKKDIFIAAGRTDLWVYPASYGLATFINKDSTWLRAICMATSGTSDNRRILIEDPPKRKNMIIASSSFDDLNCPAQEGFNPKIIARTGTYGEGFFTYNKDIKTIYDFRKRRIAIGKPRAGNTMIQNQMLKDAGIYDDVKLVHSGVSAMVDQLQDGAVDVGDTVWDVIGGKHQRGSFLEQLFARGKLYLVDIGEDLVAKACAKHGLPPLIMKVNAGFPGSWQDHPVVTYAQFNHYYADASMDEDIVYEFTRILFKHAGEYTKFALGAGSCTEEYMSASVWPMDKVKEVYHPGALRFFKESGIKVHPATN